jgi:hypothetical protein
MTKRIRYAVAITLASASTAAAQAVPARWTVDQAPLLTLGASQADTNDMFTQVVGATRLPDGRILVGDLGSYALRMFSSDGKFLRRFGRKGSGPGEIGYLKDLLRCGDSVVTIDIDGNRTSVFSLGGDYARTFRFSSPQPGRPPYSTACNARGDLVHFGWETRTDMKGGAYRPMVPLWLSKTDTVARPAIATIPGSERFGLVVDNQIRGARPLPLGRQTAIAVGPDRVYVATGDRYEVMVYDFAGKQLAPIRETRAVPPTTRADVEYAKERELALAPPGRREVAERAWDELPVPKALPTYSSLVIDASGHVWAQEYARGASPTAEWTVFDAEGRRVATTSLPTHLEVYEIGNDYVLGRFLDPDEAVPQVRLYRLRRGR